MTDKLPFSFLKPTVDTPFHIDFNWWKKHEHDWHIHLEDCLCEEHQEYFKSGNFSGEIDWIRHVILFYLFIVMFLFVLI